MCACTKKKLVELRQPDNNESIHEWLHVHQYPIPPTYPHPIPKRNIKPPTRLDMGMMNTYLLILKMLKNYHFLLFFVFCMFSMLYYWVQTVIQDKHNMDINDIRIIQNNF